MDLPNILPLEGVDVIYQYILLFFVLYILSTAFTAKLITRRRIINANQPLEEDFDDTENSLPVYENELDNNAVLSIEFISTQSAINELTRLKQENQISSDAYIELGERFNRKLEGYSTILEPETNMSEIISTPQEEVRPEPVEDNTLLDDLLEDEDDEFLKPKVKTATPKEFTAPKPEAPAPIKPAAPKQFTAPKPEAPAPIKPAAPSTLQPRAPSSIKPAAPKPVTPGISVAKPVGAEKGGSEKKYAKSTSIAAIRMDMLRELARLKKLINEDD